MDYNFISNTLLFRGLSAAEVEAALACAGAYCRRYERGETIFLSGESVDSLGLVLSGAALIYSDDIWGNRSVLGYAAAGQLFAESYACLPAEPLLVSVAAEQAGEILFIKTARLLTTCTNACAHHQRLIRNLLQLAAQKNLGLSRRILHTSSKSIRGRLLSYLSEQAKLNGSLSFSIPFNRQQLADYLGVDRSAMSNELSKMRAAGALDYDKNQFTLKQHYDSGIDGGAR